MGKQKKNTKAYYVRGEWFNPATQRGIYMRFIVVSDGRDAVEMIEKHCGIRRLKVLRNIIRAPAVIGVD